MRLIVGVAAGVGIFVIVVVVVKKAGVNAYVCLCVSKYASESIRIAHKNQESQCAAISMPHKINAFSDVA